VKYLACNVHQSLEVGCLQELSETSLYSLQYFW
jgi:hypothetical protein